MILHSGDHEALFGRVVTHNNLSAASKTGCCALDRGRHADGQVDDCAVYEAGITGHRQDEEGTFTCANESFVSAVLLNLASTIVWGLKLECSSGEESDWFGTAHTSNFDAAAECSGGWTAFTTSPDFRGFITNAYFYCHDEHGGYSDGEDLGPYP